MKQRKLLTLDVVNNFEIFKLNKTKANMNFHHMLIKEINKILQASDLTRLSKFSIIGVLNTIIGYGLFVIFLNWFSYFWALAFSHIIAVTHSYLWNKFWTFKSDRNIFAEFIRFNSVYLLVFLINAITLFLLVDILNFDPRIGQIFALPVITIISFTGHKYWSFR